MAAAQPLEDGGAIRRTSIMSFVMTYPRGAQSGNISKRAEVKILVTNPPHKAAAVLSSTAMPQLIKTISIIATKPNATKVIIFVVASSEQENRTPSLSQRFIPAIPSVVS
ncbi:MAG TPA: hypothetical protein PLI09_11510 [Candidatus Hydrogenedentes bacterium]|nr:hypothetical protein [Candidatus Hydrogenedentota bacterium]